MNRVTHLRLESDGGRLVGIGGRQSDVHAVDSALIQTCTRPHSGDSDEKRSALAANISDLFKLFAMRSCSDCAVTNAGGGQRAAPPPLSPRPRIHPLVVRVF